MAANPSGLYQALLEVVHHSLAENFSIPKVRAEVCGAEILAERAEALRRRREVKASTAIFADKRYDLQAFFSGWRIQCRLDAATRKSRPPSRSTRHTETFKSPTNLKRHGCDEIWQKLGDLHGLATRWLRVPDGTGANCRCSRDLPWHNGRLTCTNRPLKVAGVLTSLPTRMLTR